MKAIDEGRQADINETARVEVLSNNVQSQMQSLIRENAKLHQQVQANLELDRQSEALQQNNNDLTEQIASTSDQLTTLKRKLIDCIGVLDHQHKCMREWAQVAERITATDR